MKSVFFTWTFLSVTKVQNYTAWFAGKDCTEKSRQKLGNYRYLSVSFPLSLHVKIILQMRLYYYY